MSNMRKLGTCLAMVVLVILALIVVMPDAYALELIDVTDTVDPDTAGLTATHTIDFTTATTGLIASVDITFPAGFDISNVAVGAVTGIGAGVVAATGQVVTYIVIAPVNVPAGTAITIELIGVVNAPVGNYTVTVATIDAIGTGIDGPTVSAPFAITSPQLVNVTDTVVPTTAGATATHTIGFTTATTATIASVDILFPAGFDVSSVAVGVVTGIGAGTVAAAGQMVTYTVTTPAGVPASTAITIELAGVVNGPAGNYTVVVVTRDAAASIIDGPTESDPFEIVDAYGSINGNVTDCQTGDPIESALVIAIRKPTLAGNAVPIEWRFWTFTDEDGYYEISDLELGEWWVIGIKRRYKLHIAKIEVPTTHDFCLELR